MGLPAVMIPTNLLPKLETILESGGVRVWATPISADDMQGGFIAVFDCKSELGDMVRVTVQTHRKLRDEGYVVVLEILSPSLRRARQQNEFLRRVEDSLRKNGATNLSAVSNV